MDAGIAMRGSCLQGFIKVSSGVKHKCPHYGKPIEVLASKSDVKAMWKGFKAESPSEAEKTSEKMLNIIKRILCIKN
jgi:hypothetical protein